MKRYNILIQATLTSKSLVKNFTFEWLISFIKRKQHADSSHPFELICSHKLQIWIAYFLHIFSSHPFEKGPDHLGGRGILADFWVPDDIESCNFQNLLVLGFPETSQNLISFGKLLFLCFQRWGPFGKSENPQKSAKMTPTCGQDDLVLSYPSIHW